MTVNSYREITKGYEVDYLLCANNYTKENSEDSAIKLFKENEIEEAKKVFILGRRFAKGTESQVG